MDFENKFLLDGHLSVFKRYIYERINTEEINRIGGLLVIYNKIKEFIKLINLDNGFEERIERAKIRSDLNYVDTRWMDFEIRSFTR